MADRRICLWSGPRNVSTALMYAFRQRTDTEVVDEPLYGHYLRVTGVDHPGRDEVLAQQETDGQRVVDEVVLGPGTRAVRLFKMMAKHLVDLDWSFLDDVDNVLLVRDPRLVVASFARQVDAVTLDETSLPTQVELFDHLTSRGRSPIVLDARLLLLNPASVLAQLCERLDLPWDPGMLAWPAGPKPEDGCWAEHWYANAHASTGFTPYRERHVELANDLAHVVDAAQPLYRRLLGHALRP